MHPFVKGICASCLALNALCSVHWKADLDPPPLSGYEHLIETAPVFASGTSAGSLLQSHYDPADMILRILQQRRK